MKRLLTTAVTLLALGGILQAEESEGKAAAGAVGEKIAKVKLHRIDGEKFQEAKLEKSPEYYILYYSASW